MAHTLAFISGSHNAGGHGSLASVVMFRFRFGSGSVPVRVHAVQQAALQSELLVHVGRKSL